MRLFVQLALGLLFLASFLVVPFSLLTTVCIAIFFAGSMGWLGFGDKAALGLPTTGRSSSSNPAYQGRTIKRPTDLLELAILNVVLSEYLRRAEELENYLGLLPGQRVWPDTPEGLDLLDMHYRVAVLTRLLKDGEVDTGQLRRLMGTERPFSHSQFIKSVTHVEIDLATAGILPQE